jgi:formamidopyrimidine-DNA glycosylase
MPELPEVHTTATMLDDMIVGQKIIDVWSGLDSKHLRYANTIKSRDYFAKFQKAIIGRKIKSVTRRAKNVLINLDNGSTILVHMKMTGHLLVGHYKFDSKADVWKAKEEGPLSDPFNQYIRVAFALSNGKHLVLSDMRKFAKVCLLQDATSLKDEFAHIGPEPLENNFDAAAFAKALSRRPNTPIKQALMDQTLIAGIGNIYSDEILWKSDVHPLSNTGAIPAKTLKTMLMNTKTILAQGIDFGGDSMSDYRNPLGESGEFQHKHNAYRRTGKPCGKRGCKGTIERTVIGGRSAHFCAKHQILYRNDMRP